MENKGIILEGKAILMRSQNMGFHGEINIAPDKMWYPQNIFLFLHENILWYSWDVPQWDASNQYHNIWRNKKNVGAFQLQKMLFSCKIAFQLQKMLLQKKKVSYLVLYA